LIATTTLDHDAFSPSDGLAPATASLAAIARDLSFNDPQARNGRDGTPDPSGTTLDRDVELWLMDPREPDPTERPDDTRSVARATR
jgi:hypothetical protein